MAFVVGRYPSLVAASRCGPAFRRSGAASGVVPATPSSTETSAPATFEVTVTVATFTTSAAIARSTSACLTAGTSAPASRYDPNERSAPAASPSCSWTSAML
jgi:hypothetical protein